MKKHSRLRMERKVRFGGSELGDTPRWFGFIRGHMQATPCSQCASRMLEATQHASRTHIDIPREELAMSTTRTAASIHPQSTAHRLSTPSKLTLGFWRLGLSTLGFWRLGLSTLGFWRLGLSTLGLSTLGLSTLGALPATAQDRPAPGGGGHGPPPEALAACRGLARGASCTVTLSDGRVSSGTCDAPAERLPLACRPGGPHGQGARRGPPPEALAACRDLARGAACDVTPPDGRVRRGTCEGGAREPLACRPGEPRHQPPPEAYSACDSTGEGELCVVESPGGAREGVCRTAPGGRLACAPHRPPAQRDVP
jgi:hypothetical protein